VTSGPHFRPHFLWAITLKIFRKFLPGVLAVGYSGMAEAEFFNPDPVEVFLPNSEYFCEVDDLRIVALGSRAEWRTDLPVSSYAPYAYTFVFTGSIDSLAQFLVVEEDPEGAGAPRKLVQTIITRSSDGSEEDHILFRGSLGEGLLVGSTLQAGSYNPARMTWSSLDGSLFLDAFLQCRRVGPNTQYQRD